MYYLSHQTLNTDHGIILDVAVTAGDASDKAPYLAQMERVMRLLPVQKATADSAYDFGLAHQVLGEHGASFFVRPTESDSHPSVEFRREQFQYDRDNDRFRCPNGKELTLAMVSRSAGSSLHWVYSANRADCQSCSMKERCLNKSLKDTARQLTRSVFEDAAQKNLTPNVLAYDSLLSFSIVSLLPLSVYCPLFLVQCRLCLSQFLTSFEEMHRQVNAWMLNRNSVCSTVRW